MLNIKQDKEINEEIKIRHNKSFLRNGNYNFCISY